MTDVELKEFERQIANWRRTVTGGGGGGVGHCGSVEGRYQSRRPEETRPPRIVVDELAGWFFESVWRTLRPRDKWFIKWHYVYSFKESQVIRMVMKRCGYGIHRDRYKAELLLSVTQLKKALDARIRREYASRHNLIPPQGVCMTPQGSLPRPKETEPAAAR